MTNYVNIGDVKISFGKPPVICLTKQKRAGNKIITSVRGLEAFGINMDQLVKDFKKKYVKSGVCSPKSNFFNLY